GTITGTTTDPLTYSAQGTYTIQWTFSDGNGNSSTATQTVNVRDNVNPTITAPAAVAVNVTSGCTATGVALGTPTTDDNCRVASVTSDAPSVFPLGNTTVTWTVTDAVGNTATATQVVTVRDNINPTITAPEAVAVNTNTNCTATGVSLGTPTTADNCIVASVTNNAPPAFPLGSTTVTWTVTDGSGNTATATQTVNVTDNTAPTISSAANVAYRTDRGQCSSTQTLTAPAATDNCGTVTVVAKVGGNTITFPYAFRMGETTVTWVATDAAGNTAQTTQTVTVSPRPTRLTFAGTQSGQYSDRANLVVKLQEDEEGNAAVAGKDVVFTLGTQTITVQTDANGDARTPDTFVLGQAAGAYPLTAVYTPAASDCAYSRATANGQYTVNKEDARVTYTGSLYYSTAGTSSSNATVTLSATIQDITAILATDPAYDSHPGDIRKATVTFFIDGASVGSAPIGLVNSGDTKVGTATMNWAANIGASDSKQFTVGMVVDGWYTRSNGADNAIITVSKPLDDFITGGGYTIVTNSAGEKAGDAGTRNNFGFNVKYNKSGKNLQGNMNTILRRMENGVLRTYQVKGNAMTSLSVQPTSAGGKATFNGKASIQDITDPNNVISVGGNSTIQVTMTDNGNPGSSDQIGITVLNNGGGMWFSSNWNGVATTEKTLEAGNLVVRGGAISTGSPRVAAPESVEPTMELAVEASPNPTTGLLKVSVTGAGGQPTVKVRLYNLLQNLAGEWTMPIENGRGETTIDIQSVNGGMYLLSVEG
ncbi:MAG TPA: HYR domain-containing protein, partial [Hymenobacter sp.]|nr:HYR domain-containing protein [Hymenobacter sp.]